MPVSYFVLYRGRAEQPDAFVARYREQHVPILRQWPGIGAVLLHTPIAWSDAEPVSEAGLALMCEMRFASAEALDAALRSPARAQARQDFRDFPPFTGEV